MKCLSPISVKMPDGSRMLVGCGKCIICCAKKQREWAIRNFFELKDSVSAYFITLTYDEEYMPRSNLGIPILVKKDFQDFIKRLRRITSSDLRYFGCGEYGLTTARPHFHCILYYKHFVANDKHYYNTIMKAWKNGFVTIAEVNDNRVYYTAKYCIKSAFKQLIKDVYDDDEKMFNRFYYLFKNHPPFVLSSRRPPIGISLMKCKDICSDLLRPYVVRGGYKFSLPRLFRDKFFDDYQKEKLREQMPFDYYDHEDIDILNIYWKKVQEFKLKIKQERI